MYTKSFHITLWSENKNDLIKLEYKILDLIEDHKSKKVLSTFCLSASGTIEEKENKMKFKIVEAGVDPNHQVDHCDFCGKEFKKKDDFIKDEDYIPGDEYEEEVIQTCTHTSYVTLCRPCYNKAGNSVR